MKKIVYLFLGLFILFTFSKPVSAIENVDESTNQEYEDYIEERQLSKEIVCEYKKYVVIDDEKVKLDYKLIEDNDVDQDIISQIEENITLVNEFAKLEETSITSSGAIEFHVDEEYETQWRLYDFKISWSGVRFKFDREASITLGAIGLIANLGMIGKDIITSFKAFYKLCDRDALTALLAQTMLYLPSYGISNTICDFVNNSLANIIPVLITYNLAMMTIDVASTATAIMGAGIVMKAIKIAFECYIQAHLPSIVQSSQILYQASKYGKSSSIKIGWFTTTFEMV